MYEILADLPRGSMVLDLACASGSFPATATPATVVRIDREWRQQSTGDLFVRGDAARLPFADHGFDAVISNHSLEHFLDLEDSLREIGRVIRPEGALYVAVPDASTWTDKVYRWLGRGGGHVNAFVSAADVVECVESGTGLRLAAIRTLYSSLSFLNRHVAPRPFPRRLMLLGGGFEWTLFLYVWFSRWIDRLFHTRLGIYGWAFYFGQRPASIDLSVWRNVCIRCGAGHPGELLRERSRVRPFLGWLEVYSCPICGGLNPFIAF
ncbi:MAG: class I SAM-dependent methyltransferase [Bryobacteraceae bacterium]|jgi:SAM-dependent methyltransferase